MEVFSEFDVMYDFLEWMKSRFIMQVQLTGQDSTILHIPKEAITDDAGNMMETDFDLELTLRMHGIGLGLRIILHLHPYCTSS